jgi:hypothetical protein
LVDPSGATDTPADSGLALDAMIILLTVKFIPFFLILWIVSNVSIASYPLDMLPGVFRYGYAMPFYNLSRTVLTICFNTKNQSESF